jgi:hypothetical protein
MAGEREIFQSILTAMLSGENVLHMERRGWEMKATEVAVFTSESCPVKNGPAQS